MTLRGRVLVLSSAFLALLCFSVLTIRASVIERDRAVLELERLERARVLAAGFRTSALQQQLAVRGFLADPDERHVRSFERAGEDADAQISELSGVLGPDTGVTSTFQRAETAYRQWRNDVATEQIALGRAGRFEEARRIIAVGEGDPFVQLETLQVALQRRLGLGYENAAEVSAMAVRRINQAAGLSVLVALLLLGAAVLGIRWSVSAPLQRISTAVRAVADGDLATEIPAPGPRDIARLGHDAEQMRVQIGSRIEQLERAQQALAQHGPAVLSLRSHLAPSDLPLPSAMRVGVAMEPAQGMLAGDWYDLFELDDRIAVLSLVDVAGHGAVAGVLALKAKQLLVAALRDGRGPGDALGWTARHLGDTGELFLTVLLVELDTRSGRARYANAGHPPALVLDGGHHELLVPTGPLLGPLPGRWRTLPFELREEAMLVAYTDGVIETRNADGAEYGVERLLRVATAHFPDGPQAVATQCMQHAEDFSAPSRDDDMTVVAVALDRSPARRADEPLSSGSPAVLE